MSEKKTYKDQPDDFSRLIRQKIENHRLAVDQDSWDELELRLKPKRSKTGLWISGSVAAAVAIFLIFLIYPSEEIVLIVNEEKSIDRVLDQKHESKINAADVSFNKYSKETIAPTIIQKKDKRDIKEEDKNIIASLVRIDSVNTANNNVLEPAVEATTKPAVNTSDSASSSDDKSIINQHNKRPPSKNNERLLIAKKKNNDNKWLLAASVTSGRTFSFGNGNDAENYYSNGPLVSGAPEMDQNYTSSSPTLASSNSEILPSDAFSDIDHSLPLSFGIGIRKDFNKHIGVETGVTYTYLSTTFRKSGTPYYQSKQELHYLGIPLNFIVYLWNDPKWNIYISAGGMAEKGLRYKYRQDMYKSDNKVSSIYDKGSIDKMQWSLNASLGISYTLYRDWALYVEPRFSHYFDNQQPISIRTDKPQVFGLGGGLRYKF